MELQLVAVLLVSCISTVASHPKTSGVIPKDYYKRQILQPIPGYIPVYIKTEAEPLVRREKIKFSPNVKSQPEDAPAKVEDKKLEEVRSEIEIPLKETKGVSEKITDKGEAQRKLELSKVKDKHEKVKTPVASQRKHDLGLW